MNLKNVKVFTRKSVWTGPSSCEKRIYRAAVSQRLRHTALQCDSLVQCSLQVISYSEVAFTAILSDRLYIASSV